MVLVMPQVRLAQGRALSTVNECFSIRRQLHRTIDARATKPYPAERRDTGYRGTDTVTGRAAEAIS